VVLHSTKKSIKAQEVSFLAIIEIILSISIYWGIAVYFNTYWHIVLSLVVAPFFLLQSNESIKLSLKKFDEYNQKSKQYYNYLLYLLPVFVLINLLYLKLNYLLINIFSTFILFLFFIFLLSFLFIIFNKVNITLLLSVGYGSLIAGILNIANAIRAKFIGVLLTLKYGIKNFIENWKRQTLFTDIFIIPEIIYGIENTSDNDSYKISKILQFIKVPPSKLKDILKFNSDSPVSIWMYIIAEYIQFILFYLVAIFYRISIKASFWFYLPLLFIVKTPYLDSSKNIGKFLSELYETALAKVRFILAAIVLIAFIITHFNIGFSKYLNYPFANMIFLFYLDFKSITVWKIFQLLVAVITVTLFFYANYIRVPNISNGIELKKDMHIKSIISLNIIRNLFSFLYLLSAFIFIFHNYEIWEYKYVPDFMHNLIVNLQ